MLIFRYARNGTLEIDGLKKIAATCDVSTEGVMGAKDYFEARAKEVIVVYQVINILFLFLCYISMYNIIHAGIIQ